MRENVDVPLRLLRFIRPAMWRRRHMTSYSWETSDAAVVIGRRLRNSAFVFSWFSLWSARKRFEKGLPQKGDSICTSLLRVF